MDFKLYIKNILLNVGYQCEVDIEVSTGHFKFNQSVY